ncbi:MAG: hypothetical protein RLZZ292_1336, partial [Bacteroidota bacterium]
FSAPNHEATTKKINYITGKLDVGTVTLEKMVVTPTSSTQSDTSDVQSDEIIPTVTLSDGDVENGSSDGGQNVSGLLSAGWDPYFTAASFNLNNGGFRVRGYGFSAQEIIYMNGVPANDIEDDRADYGAWSGLNDVTRNNERDYGLSTASISFGGLEGVSSIDTRASRQRKQTLFGYLYNSNSIFRHRVSATHNTGVLKNGWAFSFSASHRWMEEGVIQGTNYYGSSYFASIDKKINDKHSLNLTAFGASIVRGRSSGTVAEMRSLAGDTYIFYNPTWGYWDAEKGIKRNSRTDNKHEPMVILRHDWTISPKTTLSTAASYQFGRNGRGGLDWYNGRDPRPDYYSKLPSYYDDPVQYDKVYQKYTTDEATRQINWGEMWQVNTDHIETVNNVDGDATKSITGKRSQYILNERRSDSKEANVYSNFQHLLSPHISLNGGLGLQYAKSHNFQSIADLLGGDFYVNLDKYAERNFPGNNTFLQNDLNHPNKIVKVGDSYGYDYNIDTRKGFLWGQASFTHRFLDYFIAGQVAQTSFWRTGNYKNGTYPDNSFGSAAKQNFSEYGGKAGFTIKLNGRNYISAIGTYMTKAPLYANAYISPRTRDEVVPTLKNEENLGGEVSYNLRTPYIKARLSAYYTQINNQTKVFSYFHNEFNTFVNLAIIGRNQENKGVELGIDAKIPFITGLSLSGVATVGDHIYTNRPTGIISADNGQILDKPTGATKLERTFYIKNYYVASGPQNAYSGGFRYVGKKYWTVSANINYFEKNYADINVDRRTDVAVADIVPGTAQYKLILDQELLPNFYTVDVALTKSQKFGKSFLNIRLGSNNLLDNHFILNAREQLRYDIANKDVTKFPTNYVWSTGRNIYLSLSYKL